MIAFGNSICWNRFDFGWGWVQTFNVRRNFELENEIKMFKHSMFIGILNWK